MKECKGIDPLRFGRVNPKDLVERGVQHIFLWKML